MKLILIVAVVLMGEVAHSAEHRGGGSCNILAGTFKGYYFFQSGIYFSSGFYIIPNKMQIT